MNLTDIRDIKALLSRHGFHFSKSMGQNFLIADWVPRDIADAAGLDEGCAVLEIGPGIGPLTRELSRRAGRVAAVELDRSLLPILAETLADCPNVEVVPGDVMKLDLAALAAEKFDGLTVKACANLPYNITTPVITKLLEAGCFQAATVMIQREVEGDPEAIFAVVKAAFAPRRKTLLNGLSAAYGSRFPKEELRRILADCGLPENVRGERLGLGQFAALARALQK